MPRISLLRFWLAALLLLAPGLLSAQTQTAASGSTRVLGRIIAAKVVGNVMVADRREPMRQRRLVERDELTEGQIINTGDDARVLLVFSNGATVNLAAKSTFYIEEFMQDPFSQPVKASELVDEPTTSTTKLTLIRGELMSNVKHLRHDKGSTFSVQTPVGAAGIRGTTFQILYRPAGSVASYALRMVEGKINQEFGGRARALDVIKDQQISLEGLTLDAAGRLVSLPSDIKVTEIPANIKAALAQAQQQLLEAAASVSFPAMTQSAPPQEAYPQSGGSASDGSGSGSGGPGGANAVASALSPVPPAVAPPPRTTPGDGKP
jgi:hypothetical protein